METRLKTGISRVFRSSFGSCKSKSINDIIENPVFNPDENRQQHHQLIELFSPKPRSFPSICRSPQTEESLILKEHLFPRKKISDKKTLLFPAEYNVFDGRKCPPVSPISPFTSYSLFQQCYEQNPQFEDKILKKPTRKKVRSRKKLFDKKDLPVFEYKGLFSSTDDEGYQNREEDEDDDKTTLFSSRSLSSASSSESFRRKNVKPRRRRAARKEVETGLMPLREEGVKDSFAVVKKSSDPYNDFRSSMVEMIVEKQIFAAEDLEKLLQCFLSLNSCHHHRIIIEVFTEIWETLFSNWG